MPILSYLFRQTLKIFVSILLETIKVIWCTIDKNDCRNHNIPYNDVVIMYCIILFYLSKL